MIAEYVFRYPQTGREEVKHRVPVDSPKDIEFRRQLEYLNEHQGSRYFRRVVEPKKNEPKENE
jgi:hypothetical protein